MNFVREQKGFSDKNNNNNNKIISSIFFLALLPLLVSTPKLFFLRPRCSDPMIKQLHQPTAIYSSWISRYQIMLIMMKLMAPLPAVLLL
jgi:hypothetical protein